MLEGSWGFGCRGIGGWGRRMKRTRRGGLTTSNPGFQASGGGEVWGGVCGMGCGGVE